MAVRLYLTLSILVLQGVYPVSSEICYDKVCTFDLVISAQMSHLYLPPGYRGPGYFDVELDGRDLVVANSTFRPSVLLPTFIGQTVPDPKEVITLDGVKRLILTVNGQFPAPTLEVTKDAQVVVHVKNELADQGITIHWHGLPQRSNPWMDGVPQLTQCAIPASNSFTYRFFASPAGTFWYHSHAGYQRIEGIAGMLIIHDGPPKLPYFRVLVQDWYHEEGNVIHFTNPVANPPVVASGENLWAGSASPFSLDQIDGSGLTILNYISGLIEGRGRFKDEEKWPLSTFEFQQNERYLLRVCNIGSEYPLQVSIDSHEFKVVALDGIEIQPITVDSVILYPAERTDIEVVADQPIGHYWMRSSVLKNDVGSVLETLAIVSYIGSVENVDPTTTMRQCTSGNPCTAFNCPFKYFPPSYNINCVHMSDAKRTYAPGEHAVYGLDKMEPDVEHFINLQLYFGASFNGYLYEFPETPFYQTDHNPVDCDECPEEGLCSCTFRLFLPFDKVIQLVFSNLRPGGGALDTHPVHIHGHHFAVVRMGFPDYTPGGSNVDLSQNPNPDVVCNNRPCRAASWSGGKRPTMNLIDPPLKDTVIIPAAGYTVVRFLSDNPGPWFLHCHMAHHAHQGGMAMILIEAEDHFPPIPPSMPTCSRNFSLSYEQFDHYLYKAGIAKSKGKGFKKIIPYPQLHMEPVPFPGRPQDKLYLGVGGIAGVFAAGLVGGVLLIVLPLALCMCCGCRLNTFQHKMKRNNLVSPSTRPPIYISGAPRVSYVTPSMYSSGSGFQRRVY